QPIFAPLGSKSSEALNGCPLSAVESGALASYPACTDSSRATSCTLRPMGPSVPSCDIHTSCAGAIGTRPCEGRSPNTLFQAAGLRRLPMKSEPSATGSSRCASATAAPPLLPPADFDGSYALRVTPKTSLKVCEPNPNSGVFVLPTTMQPAAFMRRASRPSSFGTNWRINGEPSVVGRPAL